MRKSLLILGYSANESILLSELSNVGFDVSQTSNSVQDLSKFDLVISYGYNKILDQKTIESAQRPVINMHISYLPFNRGMHPNFWSFFDETPSGISIHEIEQSIDTGPIMFQKEMHFQPKDQTFAQTYSLLRSAIEDLLLTNLKAILNDDFASQPQRGGGTYHAKKDLPSDFRGWNCNIYNEITRLRKIKSI
jgi:methionyl-tRNA formyltransferase